MRPSTRNTLRPRPRPATVMVYVLGVLTLLALMGLILISKTHTDLKRTNNERSASAAQVAANGLIRLVQETLRRDIWGTPGDVEVPLNNDSRPFSTANPQGLLENNEPFDAPGPDDRWLASTLPHYPVENDVAIPQDAPYPYNLGLAEDQVLAWHRVSYLGQDVIRGGINPFRWKTNARTGVDSSGVSYNDDNLRDVPILQTPPPALTGNLIPGSTTNVTIAVARRIWEADPPTGLTFATQFPYFDTNADQIVDLYDADGDGVPDSPISFPVAIDTADPNDPKQLYAVIRVVDNASMLNVNVAASLELSDGNLTFSESSPDFQRRGRRATELLLDDVVHADDGFAVSNRTGQLLGYRTNGVNNPTAYDVNIVRRWLVGGSWPTGFDYDPYGLGDEASLRHRWMLVPTDRLGDRTPPAGTQTATIDRMLPGTLLWSRVLIGNSYDPSQTPRWNRLNANFVGVDYEGYDNADGLGWRSLLREDEPFAVRRGELTTLSREVVPPPPGIALNAARDGVVGLSSHPVAFAPDDPETDGFLMDWPVLDATQFPDLPNWFRVLPIDINMSDPADGVPAIDVKRRFMQYIAAAVYLATQGVHNYQGFPLEDLSSTPGEDETLNREFLAWQFAANVADYRDSDAEPTVLEWVYDPATPRSRSIYGVEKQPFFTEAFAHLTVEEEEGPSGEHMPGGDPQHWFFAVELYVPPLWRIPSENLYFRMPDVASSVTLLPLADFRRIDDNQMPGTLDGGATGVYYVFCGLSDHAPTGLDTGSFYRHNGFEIATNGSGAVQLVWVPSGVAADWGDRRCHVIDVIGPAQSGGALAGGTSSGLGRWANKRKPTGELWGPDDVIPDWSLQRSTKGWRFTAAWQVFSETGPLGEHLPDYPPDPSLGTVNGNYSGLDTNIPESVWPTLVSTSTASHEPLFPNHGGTLVEGFKSGTPYEAFDSVGELSRQLMIGPIRRVDSLPPPWVSDTPDDNVPATLLLARTLEMVGTGDDDQSTSPRQTGRQIQAGRLDFVLAKPVGGQPWSHRLLSYLAVGTPPYDAVDNDGDDFPDLYDPDEGAVLLNRVAGRININTAPASVLRSLPYLSLLPTSAEYVRHYLAGVPDPDPAGTLAGNPLDVPGGFWDLASAIVARREGRQVPLRLWRQVNNRLEEVAIAGCPLGPGGGGPGGESGEPPLPGAMEPPRPFATVAELANMLDVEDVSLGGGDALFRPDRFWAYRATAFLDAHDLDPAQGDSLSADFRYRSDGAGGSLIDYRYLGTVPPAAPCDNGGMRGRDALYARLANLLTTRSDVFTAYIALIDENGNYVHRCQVTLDRSECFREARDWPDDPRRLPILPRILLRVDGSYADDTR